MYQMKRSIDMEHSLCLPVCFCFHQLGLCSVSYTANEYSYLANIFRGRIEYELIYSLRGAKHRVDYSVHIR